MTQPETLPCGHGLIALFGLIASAPASLRNRCLVGLCGVVGDDVYDAPTLRLGWTADDFERWLEDLFNRLLLTNPRP